MRNTEQIADLADLIGTPELVREVPAEIIPRLIGALELQAAGLERLKAELWARLLRAQSDHVAGRVSNSDRATVRSETGGQSKHFRAPAARGDRRPSVRDAASDAYKHNLMTVRQFCGAHPAFTEGSVRWLLFNRATNGLSVALVKKGRRLWIDVDSFFDWLEQGEPTSQAAVG